MMSQQREQRFFVVEVEGLRHWLLFDRPLNSNVAYTHDSGYGSDNLPRWCYMAVIKSIIENFRIGGEMHQPNNVVIREVTKGKVDA